jgi:outer membrane protein OmpA-like peptidoglycan-associated protein
MKIRKIAKALFIYSLSISFAGLAGAIPANAAVSPAVVNLGSAESFAVLAATYATTGAPSTFNGNIAAGAAITTGASNLIVGSAYSGAATNVGASSSITGNLYSGAAITLGAGSTVSGSQIASDSPQYSNATSIYTSAMSSVNTAITDINNRTATYISGTLDGVTLTPGIYSSVTGLGLTGVLTLDAQGDSNAVFIIRSNSYLVTAASSAVVLTNQAQAKNIFWAPQDYFTAGPDSVFKGNVLAANYVSIGARTAIEGRLFSRLSYVVFGSGNADSVFGIEGIGTTEIPAPGLSPTFATPTPTADGFTVQISNYSDSYAWVCTATANGTAVVSGTGLVTVSGVAAYTTSTATFTTTRTGYTDGTASISATSLPAAAVKTIEFTDTTLVDGTKGQVYSDFVAARTLLNGSANSQTVTYAISPSLSDLGLSMDTAGVLTGTVSTTATVGTHSFTVTATSAGYVTETFVYSLVIKAAGVPPIAIYKTLKFSVYFGPGSSKLTLYQQGRLLIFIKKLAPKVIDGLVYGYVQKSNSKRNDIALSLARARVVSKFLSLHGVKAPLQVKGKGSLNSSAASRTVRLSLRYKQWNAPIAITFDFLRT